MSYDPLKLRHFVDMTFESHATFCSQACQHIKSSVDLECKQTEMFQLSSLRSQNDGETVFNECHDFQGAFNYGYRKGIIEDWISSCNKNAINCSMDFTLTRTLGDPVQVHFNSINS